MRYRRDDCYVSSTRHRESFDAVERRNPSHWFWKMITISVAIIALFMIEVLAKKYERREPLGEMNGELKNEAELPLNGMASESIVNTRWSSVVGAVNKTSDTLKGSVNISYSSTFVPDACAAEWTADRLVGRCFGLKATSEFPQYSNQEISSPTACQQICCELGPKCVTWQYWEGLKICKVGKAIRLGKEAGPTPNWCDDSPPVQWFGQKVLSRNGTGVTWGARLTTQCFGLGPERMKQKADSKESSQDTSFSPRECQQQCRLSQKCNIWQAHPKRGCYFAFIPNAFCEPYTGSYFGRRKCKLPYCKEPFSTKDQAGV